MIANKQSESMSLNFSCGYVVVVLNANMRITGGVLFTLKMYFPKRKEGGRLRGTIQGREYNVAKLHWAAALSNSKNYANIKTTAITTTHSLSII